jgi:hypothetical protein
VSAVHTLPWSLHGDVGGPAAVEGQVVMARVGYEVRTCNFGIMSGAASASIWESTARASSQRGWRWSQGAAAQWRGGFAACQRTAVTKFVCGSPIGSVRHRPPPWTAVKGSECSTTTCQGTDTCLLDDSGQMQTDGDPTTCESMAG